LAPHYRLALPPDEAAAAAIDKRHQYDLAKTASIPCAETWYPESLTDVENIKDRIPYPAFIKPTVGHVWRESHPTKGFLVQNSTELLHRCRELLPSDTAIMIQSYILGPASNTYSVGLYMSAAGDCIAACVARKLRHAGAAAGVGTLVVTCRADELIELSVRFARAMRFHGIAELEFKQDDRDGVFKLIELNPRLWLQAQLAVDSGIDLPLIQYLDLTGQPMPEKATYREGVIWLDWVDDYHICRLLYLQGELSTAQWITSWLSARSHATFAVDDIKPFLAAGRPAARIIINNLMRRVARFGRRPYPGNDASAQRREGHQIASK
jgi:predicted ATP-grasp superfamily ATP-dependent carboligase